MDACLRPPTRQRGADVVLSHSMLFFRDSGFDIHDFCLTNEWLDVIKTGTDATNTVETRCWCALTPDRTIACCVATVPTQSMTLDF